MVQEYVMLESLHSVWIHPLLYVALNQVISQNNHLIHLCEPGIGEMTETFLLHPRSSSRLPFPGLFDASEIPFGPSGQGISPSCA